MQKEDIEEKFGDKAGDRKFGASNTGLSTGIEDLETH